MHLSLSLSLSLVCVLVCACVCVGARLHPGMSRVLTPLHVAQQQRAHSLALYRRLLREAARFPTASSRLRAHNKVQQEFRLRSMQPGVTVSAVIVPRLLEQGAHALQGLRSLRLDSEALAAAGTSTTHTEDRGQAQRSQS